MTLPRAAVCLAAGPTQLPVIQRARERGLAVVGVDRDANAPGFAQCDASVLASTHDAAEVLRGLAPLRREYDLCAVLNRSAGPPVVTAAVLCSALGLPGVPLHSARTCIDKAALRKACVRFGLAAPGAVEVGALDDPARAAFPCVVKPALSLVGKAGVRVVSRPRELPAAVAAARAASFTGGVVIERFAAGVDVTLIAFVRNRELLPLALIDELNAVDATGRVSGRGVACPSEFAGSAEGAAVIALASKLARALSLDRTPLLVSCRCAPGVAPQLIEVHLDLGGDLVLDQLLPACAPFDALGLAVDWLAGGDAPLPLGPFRPATVLFDAPPAGVRRRGRTLHTAPRAASAPAPERALPANWRSR